jgi:hypothetical protein
VEAAARKMSFITVPSTRILVLLHPRILIEIGGVKLVQVLTATGPDREDKDSEGDLERLASRSYVIAR